MSYTMIWLYSPAEGPKRVLIGHPGTFSETDEEARNEGRAILNDDQIDKEDRDSLQGVASVEVNDDMADDIQEKCEEVEIGTELLFYDLDNFPQWQSKTWWPKT